MPDSLPLLCWKLLAFLESIKTSWDFKVITKSIMLAWITSNLCQLVPLSGYAAMCGRGVGERSACSYECTLTYCKCVGVRKSMKLKLQMMAQRDSFSYLIVLSLIKWTRLAWEFSEKTIRRGKHSFKANCAAKLQSPAGESNSDTSLWIATNRKCWQELLSLVLICMHGNLFHLKEY